MPKSILKNLVDPDNKLKLEVGRHGGLSLSFGITQWTGTDPEYDENCVANLIVWMDNDNIGNIVIGVDAYGYYDRSRFLKTTGLRDHWGINKVINFDFCQACFSLSDPDVGENCRHVINLIVPYLSDKNNLSISGLEILNGS